MLDLSGISLPFGVNDMIDGSTAIIGLVSGFVVLYLVFIFTPALIRLIKYTIHYESKALPHRLRGTLERQDRDGNPIRGWSSRNT